MEKKTIGCEAQKLNYVILENKKVLYTREISYDEISNFFLDLY